MRRKFSLRCWCWHFTVYNCVYTFSGIHIIDFFLQVISQASMPDDILTLANLTCIPFAYHVMSLQWFLSSHHPRRQTKMTILSRKKAENLSLFSTSSKWITSGQNAGNSLENLGNVCFFLSKSNLIHPADEALYCFGCQWDFLVITDDRTTAYMYMDP